MSIDINTLRALATVLCFFAFLAVVLWAWSDGKRKDFEQAALLPFADDEPPESQSASSGSARLSD